MLDGVDSLCRESPADHAVLVIQLSLNGNKEEHVGDPGSACLHFGNFSRFGHYSLVFLEKPVRLIYVNVSDPGAWTRCGYFLLTIYFQRE